MAREKTSMRRKCAVVRKWRTSGLKQSDFCRAEGLKEWQLSDWKRAVARHEEQDGLTPDGPAMAANGSVERRTRQKRRRQQPIKVAEESQKFVPVQLVGEDIE